MMREASRAGLLKIALALSQAPTVSHAPNQFHVRAEVSGMPTEAWQSRFVGLLSKTRAAGNRRDKELGYGKGDKEHPPRSLVPASRTHYRLGFPM